VGDVKRYIQSQKQHHRRITFQDEFRKFLKKYQIEYDERYVIENIPRLQRWELDDV